MFCGKCGNQLAAPGAVCTNCGAPAHQEAQGALAQPQAHQQLPQPYQ